ncbi:MAG: hypothetical protein LBM23_10985 [Propionibacteriaceae bacterium]|jgi:hypothetical protein|nr:hypothetical protein [Propionibacteriaceae bacterium]
MPHFVSLLDGDVDASVATHSPSAPARGHRRPSGIEGLIDHAQRIIPLLRRSRVGWLLFLCFVAVDLALVPVAALHIFRGDPAEWVYGLGADRTFGEFFNYIKFFTAIVLFAGLAWRSRSGRPVFVFYACFCAALLIDDAVYLHEKAGWFVAGLVPEGTITLSIALQIGELAFMGLVAAGAVIAFAVIYRHGSLQSRSLQTTIGLAFVPFFFFAVVVDTFHNVVNDYATYAVNEILVLIEDGGELPSVSLIVAVAVALCALVPDRPRDGAPSGAVPYSPEKENADQALV